MTAPRTPSLLRLPPVPESAMTQAQREAVEAVIRTPRGKMLGPFVPMLHSPEFLNRAQRLGEYLRYAGAIPMRLREFAILVTARHWSQTYEWYIHAPIAEKEGVPRTTIDELAAAARPAAMTPEETVIYDFCMELQRSHGVSDATYQAAQRLLGDAGVVDLCGICGYYSMLAMVMNVARTPLPEGERPAF
jgi:4-carboxymuconolactone decarboxylase